MCANYRDEVLHNTKYHLIRTNNVIEYSLSLFLRVGVMNRRILFIGNTCLPYWLFHYKIAY